MRRILFMVLAVVVTGGVILYLPRTQRASSISLHPTGIKLLFVHSPAFKPGGRIPKRFTADGQGVSVPMVWSHVPQGVKSFAVLMEDTDAPGTKAFTHWVIWDIPAQVRALPAGVKAIARPPRPQGSRQGRNDFGHLGYGGPAPPPGPVHHYHLMVYALNNVPEVAAGATARTLILAMEGHLVAWGHLTGIYRRR